LLVAAFSFPFWLSIFVYAMLRSAYTTLANGGVEWRGTWYPLGQLKENVV
jgi:hypothetical protein